MSHFNLLRERLALLPVHPIVPEVVANVQSGRITIVAASTGSGKSMILPGALADQSDHQVVVLAPRRFLALDAAFNVAELAGLTVGAEVGYALGQMDRESSRHSSQTRLLYCTYGYAIRSGLINRARTLVLDEVHEADEQISLARAILYERKRLKGDVQILEMSATVDAPLQARYWQKIAQTAIHTVEGQALACEAVHESPMLAGRKDRTAEDIAIELLTRGRRGIVLFRPGVREVEDSVALLIEKLAALGITDTDVVGIHGSTPSDERRRARSGPLQGRRKIIVGTNVIESGVNLRWLDAGISDGYRKIPYHRDDTGADALVLEDIPQSGLLQQMGRINRDPQATGFERGLFVLHAQRPFNLRRTQNGPAIQRQSLNDVSFHAASLGYNPMDLTWDVMSRAHADDLLPRLETAKEELVRLNLIRDDWSLTEDGALSARLPISPETGAMLTQAKRIDEQHLRARRPARVMRDMVIIAAIAEGHGLRDKTRVGHNGDQYRTSDLLDALNAFRAIRDLPVAQQVLDADEIFLAQATDEELETLRKHREELETLCSNRNMTLNGFVETAHLADEIASRTEKIERGLKVQPRQADDKYDSERYGELQRCFLSGNANRLFLYENDGLRDLLRDYDKHRNHAGQPFNGYILGRGTIVGPPKAGAFFVGLLREVPADSKGIALPLLVLTMVSAIPVDVLLDWGIEKLSMHDPVFEDMALHGSIFTARYRDKATFEVTIPAGTQSKARRLIELASTL